MALKFCPKCNHGTQQLDVQIKFCSQCGYNFVSASMPKIEVQPTIKYQEREEIQKNPRPQSNRLNKLRKSTARQEEYYEDEDINNDREFVNLDFDPPEIELENIPTRPKVTLGNLAVDRSPKENISRPKLKKMNKKQIEEQFRNEVSKQGSKELGFGNMRE